MTGRATERRHQRRKGVGLRPTAPATGGRDHASGPRLSVLMPVYNAERFLVEALDSLLAQSWSAFELIAVDDASSDASSQILHAYAGRDPRLRVIRQAVNGGVPAALNAGLHACRGELVARADADDVYARDRFAHQIAFLDRHPNIGVLSCGFQRMDPTGTLMDIDRPITGPSVIRFCMNFMNCLLHPGVVFRTAPVRRVGGYDERYWTAQDSDLWARLLPVTQFDNLPDTLVRYRVHPASRMKTRGEAGKRLSLSVPQRLLSAYLGRTVPISDVEAASELFRSSRPIGWAIIRTGLAVFREVVAQAERVEPAPVRRFFRHKVARSLVRQARHRERRAAAGLYMEAARWRHDVALAELGGYFADRSRRRQVQKIDAGRW
ncbi:MAG: glycosyltransferase family 2 protein [Rhodothalassiaceae bacterium]